MDRRHTATHWKPSPREAAAYLSESGSDTSSRGWAVPDRTIPPDSHGGLLHVLVLPDPEDPPSEGEQMSVCLTIPLDVACEFRCPPRRVVGG